MTLLKLITNPLSIFRGPVKKGSKTLPITLDFTATQLYTIDFNTLEFQEFLEVAQTIFADNSLNASPLIVTCSGTGQVITFPAKSCGYVPLLQPVPGTLDIFTVGSVVINIQLLNFHVDPNVWSVSPSLAPSGGGGLIPTGRLTLTTLTPVLTQDVTGATTIFYTPYIGNTVPIFDGVKWTSTIFAELSQTLADTTKSPAAAILNSLYDLFVWNDAGTIRCTRGPKWTVSSAPSARGVGAGTTELIREPIGGLLVNRFAVTNGPPALQGLYVGTILTSSTVTVNMQSFPVPVAGGSGNFLSVWNMYNRINVTSINRDNSASHTYTNVVFQVKAASNANGTNFICGLIEDQFTAIDTEIMSSTVADAAYIAWGLNSTGIQANFPITMISEQVVGKPACGTVTLCDYPSLGANTVFPLEATQATGVHTFTTNAAIGGVNVITGTVFNFRM